MGHVFLIAKLVKTLADLFFFTFIRARRLNGLVLNSLSFSSSKNNSLSTWYSGPETREIIV